MKKTALMFSLARVSKIGTVYSDGPSSKVRRTTFWSAAAGSLGARGRPMPRGIQVTAGLAGTGVGSTTTGGGAGFPAPLGGVGGGA